MSDIEERTIDTRRRCFRCFQKLLLYIEISKPHNNSLNLVTNCQISIHYMLRMPHGTECTLKDENGKFVEDRREALQVMAIS
jgi:hypothetical protein